MIDALPEFSAPLPWMTPEALEVKRLAGRQTVLNCRRYKARRWQRVYAAAKRQRIRDAKRKQLNDDNGN